jgi:hypothetical protein
MLIAVAAEDPRDVLVDAALRIRSHKHHPNCIGIQFVQIGNDEGAEEALKNLMFGDIGVSLSSFLMMVLS